MVMENIIIIFGGAILLLLLWTATKTVEWLWWKPRRLEKALRAQGLKGTPYRFLHGDNKESILLDEEAKSKPMSLSHDVIPRVAPFIQNSINHYGKMSFTWSGTTPTVTISDPALIREVLSNKLGHFEKAQINPIVKELATGLFNYEGKKWSKHRRILNPAFHVEKIKLLLPAFSTCCIDLVNRWDSLVSPKGSCELDIWPEFQTFTGHVISRTAFGSSYEEGRQIFERLGELIELMIQAARIVYIPGYRFLPTAMNRRIKVVDGEIKTTVRGIIEKREEAMKHGIANYKDDVLSLLMASNRNEQHGKSSNIGITTADMINECKIFYFAGQETTAVLVTWTMILLSMHPSWQSRAREEVLEVFEDKPDNDGLSRLKIVTMILYEVLRLYPPVLLLNRKTYKPMKLGGVTFPEGVVLSLALLFVHHDPEYWGEDANEFKPERFAEGISKASKDQVAFFPFGWGPRTCIAQGFALTEAKLCLSMILQKFSFELSPSYAHAPFNVVTLQPQHGAQVILHKL